MICARSVPASEKMFGACMNTRAPWLVASLRLVLGLLLSLTACEKTSKPAREDPSAAGTTSRTKPDGTGATAKAATNVVDLVVVYGSEKKTWFEEQIKAFDASQPKTKSGRPIRVVAKAMGSGEAMQAITSGSSKAHVFSPASSAYIPMLNEAWLSQAGHTKPLVPQGDALVLSPVVIAMWKPMAEALGWPKKQLSWSDLLKVSTNPKGWAAYGFPEWGAFKLGHTHPEYSNSGLLTVLATAYAGAKKTRGLTVADVDAKPTQAFLAAVEEPIVHYGKSTGFFADKMIERGPSYLSAAVLYENLIIESYAKSSSVPLVAVYPVEGTFWSDHPYSIVDAEWVGEEERSAADAFHTFLKAKPAQQRALELGFRPGDPSIAVGAPIDAAHGVDPKQPQAILPVPDIKTLDKVVTAWSATKKGADIVLVFDKSGSMKGRPLESAKGGAKSFVDALSERDEVSLMFFDDKIYPPTSPVRMSAEAKKSLGQRLDGVTADGGTALYDALLMAVDDARKRAKEKPNQIHAVVLMTDGKDENSKLTTFPTLKTRLADEGAGSVRVFTIGYGAGAEKRILMDLAEAAKGSYEHGEVASIREVFIDMAAFL